MEHQHRLRHLRRGPGRPPSAGTLHDCMYIYISLSLYIYIFVSLSLSIYIYIYSFFGAHAWPTFHNGFRECRSEILESPNHEEAFTRNAFNRSMIITTIISSTIIIIIIIIIIISSSSITIIIITGTLHDSPNHAQAFTPKCLRRLNAQGSGPTGRIELREPDCTQG